MTLAHKKTILRKIPSGLFIVTAKNDDKIAGATISFLTQVSLEPPLIALSIRKNSNLFAVAENCNHLAIHFPSEEQQDIVASFFKVKELTKDVINGYHFNISELGNPLLNEIPMILEVKTIDIIDKGDHPVFICEVVNTILHQDTEVLTMADTNWHYGG